ncbi:unnamed protein product [Symbiodinium sp. KB8]|nr:unnamed protein product [Symbiodinium sp. KB8]
MLDFGSILLTEAPNLQVRYVLHTAVPGYPGSRDPRPMPADRAADYAVDELQAEALLKRSFQGILQHTAELGATSLCCPAIGCGVRGFPPEVAARVGLTVLADNNWTARTTKSGRDRGAAARSRRRCNMLRFASGIIKSYKHGSERLVSTEVLWKLRYAKSPPLSCGKAIRSQRGQKRDARLSLASARSHEAEEETGPLRKVPQGAQSCFNQDGDLKVAVLCNGSVKAEFRVYSKLLSGWSPTLAHQVEKSGDRWEIMNFSSAAVDAFLRFLYSGKLSTNMTVAVEAALMAEIYDIQEPSQICEAMLLNGTSLSDVYAMLEVAHRFPEVGERLRGACLRALLADPEQSLQDAWTLSPKLLEELLATATNDIGDYELAKMILSWQEKNPHQSFANMLQDHVSLGGLSEERYSDIRTYAEQVGLGFAVDQMWATAQAATGDWTPDLFKYMEGKWQEQCQEHRRAMPFVGCWMNLIPSSLGWKPPPHSHGPHKAQEEVARNVLNLDLHPGEAMTWFLPIHTIHVSGISFTEPVSGVLPGGEASVEVFSSSNGCQWDLLWSSARNNFSCRTKERVRWFKLSAKHQTFSNKLQIQGVVHAG